MVTGHYWHISGCHYFFRLALAAHGGDGGGRRANEANAFADTLLCKSCIFTEEAKPWMEGLALALEGDLQDFISVEVTLSYVTL